jgi:hypothetical protein
MQVTATEYTYGLKVRVRVGGDECAAYRSAAEWTNTEIRNRNEISDAMGWTVQDTDRAFIWLRYWPESRRRGNSKTLVHECLHVAMTFLRDHVREDIRKAEETCCYLLQYLYDEITHKLKQRKKFR